MSSLPLRSAEPQDEQIIESKDSSNIDVGVSMLMHKSQQLPITSTDYEGNTNHSHSPSWNVQQNEMEIQHQQYEAPIEPEQPGRLSAGRSDATSPSNSRERAFGVPDGSFEHDASAACDTAGLGLGLGLEIVGFGRLARESGVSGGHEHTSEQGGSEQHVQHVAWGNAFPDESAIGDRGGYGGTADGNSNAQDNEAANGVRNADVEGHEAFAVPADILSPLSLDIRSFPIALSAENALIGLEPDISAVNSNLPSLHYELSQFVAHLTCENVRQVSLTWAPQLRPVNLPAEYPGMTISLNPLLTSPRAREFAGRIHWNTSQPASRAAIPDVQRRTWWNQPTTRPTVGSMTLHIDGLLSSKPIVVFPRTSENTFVTIGDVLHAVKYAHVAGGVHGSFPIGMRWGGMRRSPDELDVWVVDIHRR